MPKYRKKLNKEQLQVLEILYKFRFCSNDLVAEYFGKKGRAFVHNRLSILLEQGLIAKRFDSSYRLRGRPAAYYLTPGGARALMNKQEGLEVNIKSIYKDGSVSEKFVDTCLEIFTIRNRLKNQYADKLKFFTRANLNYEDYDYFPKPLPHAYLRLESGKQFFLDVLHEDDPSFVVKRRIGQYIDYCETGEWEETGTDFPIVLLACESKILEERVKKQVDLITSKRLIEEIDIQVIQTGELELPYQNFLRLHTCLQVGSTYFPKKNRLYSITETQDYQRDRSLHPIFPLETTH